MTKRSTLNITKNMADKIPYIRCYEEHGIIETENKVFTRGYEIRKPEEQIHSQYNIQFIRSCMETILKDVAEEGLSYQFCVRNRRVDEQGYLQNLLAKNHGEEKLDIYARAYNTTIQDNTSVGHNNFETRIYYIVSYLSDIVEEAIEKFQEVDLSVHYQPIDSEIGFSASVREVKNNVYTKVIPIRDTVEDRKAGRTKVKEYQVNETEKTHYNNAALELFKESVAKNNPTILTSFVIVLFADDLDELDRDTRLLKLYASKYAVQVRTADKLQNEAFQSILPLNNVKMDVKRTFTVERLSTMSPMNVQALFEQIKAFHGLNAINDNLVLIDRKNSLSGMIVGIQHRGKTSACKREAFNALATTDDEIIILTKHPEQYEYFVNELDGSIVYGFNPDFAEVNENYNLFEVPEELRKLVLEAAITYGNGFYKKKYKSLSGDMVDSLEDEKKKAYRKVEVEVERLKEFSNFMEMFEYAATNYVQFEMFLSVMDKYRVYEYLPENSLQKS